MTTILAIDPGPTTSAWLLFTDGRPTWHEIVGNEQLAAHLRSLPLDGTAGPTVVIEAIEPRYGLHMGWETLDTARWTGVFAEAARPLQVEFLRRSEILRHLGVVTTPRKGERRVSADAGAWQALLDRFGGKDAAVGRKASPGPLHGITSHARAALAVAVTYADKLQEDPR